jgi:hypothetical protein
MPARSKAQQRYMAIAEHNPTALYGPKPNMTHQQFHDFAATPRTGLPQHVKPLKPVKPMHPKMVQRAQLTKEAHAHLGSAIPGFHGLPKAQKMGLAQLHVNLRLGKVR